MALVRITYGAALVRVLYKASGYLLVLGFGLQEDDVRGTHSVKSPFMHLQMNRLLKLTLAVPRSPRHLLRSPTSCTELLLFCGDFRLLLVA